MAHGRAFALAPWCLLVFTLVVLHLALMTNEYHNNTAEFHRAGALTVDTVAVSMTMSPLAAHGDHDTPRNTLAGCPVGQAILPLIALLLGMAGFYFASSSIDTAGATAAVRRALPPMPPPLSATQRRAFLQTFII